MLLASLQVKAEAGKDKDNINQQYQKTSGVSDIKVNVGAVDDQVCFSIYTQCRREDLEAIRVFRDHKLIHTSSPAREIGLDFDLGNICLDESGIKQGRHKYTVEAVCASKVLLGGVFHLNVRQPLLRIISIDANQMTYRVGDEIILEVVLEGRSSKAIVSADFSILDTGYRRGAETVKKIGKGRYVVRYILSKDNTRSSGDYAVPVEVSLGLDKYSKINRSQTLSLRYLRNGQGTLRFDGGTFMPADMTVDVTTDPRLEILDAKVVTVDPKHGPVVPQMFSTERGTSGGEVVYFDVAVPKGLTKKIGWLEIAEPSASGITSIPISLEKPSVCDKTRCTHRVSASLLRDRSAPATMQARLTISPGPTEQNEYGPIDDYVFDSSCDSDPETSLPLCRQPDNFEVFGQITFTQTVLVVDSSTSHPTQPVLKGILTRYRTTQPAREILVRISDGCGGFSDGYTDSHGNYMIPFKSFCGDETATVTAYSLTSHSAGRRMAIGLHTGATPPQTFDDLQPAPSDYTIFSGQVGLFVPDATTDGRTRQDRFFLSTERGSLASQGHFSRDGEMARALGLIGHTLRALTYYGALISVNRLPQINIVLVNNPLVPKDNTGIYSPSRSHMIHIPPSGEYSEFLIVHELSHYFHGLTIKNVLDSYGRFTEPMANVMAGMINDTPWMIPFDNLAAENLDVQGFYSNGILVNTSFIPVGTLNCSTSVPRTFTDNCAFFFQRILWDLHDGAESPSSPSEPEDFGFGAFDFWNGSGSTSPNRHLMNGVMLLWPPQVDGSGGNHPEYEDRGMDNMDLIDVLDGMACLYDMGSGDISKLLRQVMGYDYDFAKCQEPIISQ